MLQMRHWGSVVLFIHNTRFNVLGWEDDDIVVMRACVGRVNLMESSFFNCKNY